MFKLLNVCICNENSIQWQQYRTSNYMYHVLGSTVYSVSLCRDGQKTKWRLQCKYQRSNADSSPGGEFYAFKHSQICSLVLPQLYMELRLLVNVVRVTNLEVVKIEFRHLPFLLLLSFFLSFFSQPSALTRAVPRTRYSRIAVKLFEDVPFELSFQRNSNTNPALSRSRSVVS